MYVSSMTMTVSCYVISNFCVTFGDKDLNWNITFPLLNPLFPGKQIPQEHSNKRCYEHYAMRYKEVVMRWSHLLQKGSETFLIQDHICSLFSVSVQERKQDLFVGRVAISPEYNGWAVVVFM